MSPSIYNVALSIIFILPFYSLHLSIPPMPHLCDFPSVLFILYIFNRSLSISFALLLAISFVLPSFPIHLHSLSILHPSSFPFIPSSPLSTLCSLPSNAFSFPFLLSSHYLISLSSIHYNISTDGERIGWNVVDTETSVWSQITRDRARSTIRWWYSRTTLKSFWPSIKHKYQWIIKRRREKTEYLSVQNFGKERSKINWENGDKSGG